MEYSPSSVCGVSVGVKHAVERIARVQRAHHTVPTAMLDNDAPPHPSRRRRRPSRSHHLGEAQHGITFACVVPLRFSFLPTACSEASSVATHLLRFDARHRGAVLQEPVLHGVCQAPVRRVPAVPHCACAARSCNGLIHDGGGSERVRERESHITPLARLPTPVIVHMFLSSISLFASSDFSKLSFHLLCRPRTAVALRTDFLVLTAPIMHACAQAQIA